MTEYRAILMTAIKTAKKCYILEPSIEGKREWKRLIKECLKELEESNTTKIN